MIQDTIEQALVDRFVSNDLDLTIAWERVERYAIDDASRMKAAAIGLVDQGQKFAYKTSLMDVTWRMAVEFFVRCNKGEEIKTKVNRARADVYRVMMADPNLGGLLDDTTPVVDEIFVDRSSNQGEGVLVFDLRYRTKTDDLADGH